AGPVRAGPLHSPSRAIPARRVTRGPSAESGGTARGRSRGPSGEGTSAVRGRTRGPSGTARASKHLSALEQRIAEAEQRLRDLERRISEVAASGNYMETRRVGDEHATLERALRELYDEWAAKSEEA
ncbi:MAG: ABC transporter C-terminal domain-containing protein, partial [Candidatus Limnocylindria bacterium]